jgi:tetrahydromethanopterin S-methyltransferase subunit G
METIIVSVLSTLGAVALVSTIVVVFIKLTNKVDVTIFDREIENIYNEVNNRVEGLNRDVQNHVTEIYQEINSRNDDIIRFIDSRCDKLDTKIQNLNNDKVSNSSQLLTD